ncbi:MAG: DUF3604 domain-containing protein [Acidobacteria bacterium]|nr:DUF3604 domain-containing protein [Acidobacteriota bacterium]
MPHSTYLPEEMGSAVISPAGSFEAGSYASFTLTYTAGRFGMDDTASLKIVFRFAADMGRLQFDDPKGANYVTVEASNNAVLETRYDPKGNLRPWDKTLYIKVVNGFMKEGDRIVVRFGDPREGSPGLRLQTFCESTFEFRVLVDAIATYNYVELPASPVIAIVPGPAAVWKAVLPTMRRVGEPFRLCMKAEDRWGNPTDQAEGRLRLRASFPVANLPEEVSYRKGEFGFFLENLTVPEPADVTIDLLDADGVLLAETNPLRIVESAELLPYWGDLHGQTEETVGTNSVGEYFTFARDRAFLDICGHQGNDFQITQDFWDELNRVTRDFDEAGRFVAVPGYEWSGNTALGGDRNVFFRREGETIRRSSHALLEDLSDVDTDCHTAADLFEALTKAGEDCAVIAHVGGRYADIKMAHDGRFERAVEIHSAWGTFEWLLADAIEKGYRVGIVCHSDGHKGRPGASYPGASWFGAYGGLTCYLMPRLDRDTWFDCLRKRRHYGTTGARMIVDIHAEFESPATVFDDDPKLGPTESREACRAEMGEVLETSDQEVRLCVDVLGSAPIERIEVRNGMETVSVVRPAAELTAGGNRIRVVWEGAEYRGRFRQTVWDGEAWFADNAILRAHPINFINPDKKLKRTDESGLRWEAITTGNFGGFDAILEDTSRGTLRFETELVKFELPVGEIGAEDLVYDAGKLGRRVRVFRLPEVNPYRGCRFEKTIRLKAGQDNPLYIAVTQEDGHRAWSSPIWVHARTKQ